MEERTFSADQDTAAEKHGWILGFRTGKTWKMILAAIYYSIFILSMVLSVLNDSLSIPLKISGVLSNLFTLTLPYLVSAIAAACRKKRAKPLVITLLVSVLSLSASYILNQIYMPKTPNYIYSQGKQHMTEALNRSGGGGVRRSSMTGNMMGAVSSAGRFMASQNQEQGETGNSHQDMSMGQANSNAGMPQGTGSMDGTMETGGYHQGMQGGGMASVSQPRWENIIKDFNSSYALGAQRHLGQRYFLHDAVYEAKGGASPYVVFKRDNMTAYMYFSQEYSDAIGRLKKGQPCSITVTCTDPPNGNTVVFTNCVIGQ